MSCVWAVSTHPALRPMLVPLSVSPLVVLSLSDLRDDIACCGRSQGYLTQKTIAAMKTTTPPRYMYTVVLVGTTHSFLSFLVLRAMLLLEPLSCHPYSCADDFSALWESIRRMSRQIGIEPHLCEWHRTICTVFFGSPYQIRPWWVYFTGSDYGTTEE